MSRFKNMGCQELRMVLEECWVRLRGLEKAHPEDYTAHLQIILRLENLLNENNC